MNRKLVGTVSAPSSRLWKVAAHPLGTSICLATAYMVLCTVYVVLTGWLPARAGLSFEQWLAVELRRGLVFAISTGAAYFGFAWFLLRRISAQQKHLLMLFHGASDSLYLLEVEAGENFRFLCSNSTFHRVIGLSRARVDGRRVEEVLPVPSVDAAKVKYLEAINGRKTVHWEESVDYPAGRRVGEVSVTPLSDAAGSVRQLVGVVRDITERKAAELKAEMYQHRLQTLSRRLVEVQETERRHIARELHDEIGQALFLVQMNLQAASQPASAGDVA